MRIRRLISTLFITAAFVLAVGIGSTAAAESGCHKGGGSPPKAAPERP